MICFLYSFITVTLLIWLCNFQSISVHVRLYVCLFVGLVVG